MSSATEYDTGSFERQTLGMVKTLEKRQEISDIKVSHNPPASKSEISTWEQKNNCMIPDDLRSFYLVMDGFSLKWNVKINDIGIPVGRMSINSLEELCKLTVGVTGEQDGGNISIADLHLDDDEDEGKDTEMSRPKFDQRSRIFELDACDGYGKVCLVYHNTKQGIPAQNADVWFLDRSLQWHFLAESFLFYYRMMLVHLGLPQWHYAFTNIGLSNSAKQWFNLFCPLRLDMDARETNFGGSALDLDPGHARPHAQLDIARVFKGKTEKKKTAAQITASQTTKKKSPFTAAKPGSGKAAMSCIQPSKLNIR